MTNKTLNQQLAKLDAALARFDAEAASSRARRTPAMQAAIKRMVASGNEYAGTRPTDAEFDYYTAQAGNGYFA